MAREPRRYARPHFKTPIPSSDVMNCRVCSHLSVRRSSILATTFGCVGLSSWRNGSRSSSRGLCIPGLAMGRRRSLLGPARAEGTEAYSSWSNLSAGIRRNNLETWSRLVELLSLKRRSTLPPSAHPQSRSTRTSHVQQ